MLQEMLQELNRLISKYSSGTWTEKPTANSLVEILMEHAFYSTGNHRGQVTREDVGPEQFPRAKDEGGTETAAGHEVE